MLAYSPDEDTSSRRHFITGTAQHVYYLTITAAVAFPVGASLRRHGHDPAVNLMTTGTCASQPRVSLPPAQAQGQLDVARRPPHLTRAQISCCSAAHHEETLAEWCQQPTRRGLDTDCQGLLPETACYQWRAAYSGLDILRRCGTITASVPCGPEQCQRIITLNKPFRRDAK